MLSDDDIAALLPTLRRIAREVGRSFPTWRMGTEDLVQVGLFTVFRLPLHAGDSPAYARNRQCAAARNQMIEALRAWEDTRQVIKQQHLPVAKQNARKMEYLVDDFRHLADNAFPVESSEDILLREEEAYLKLKRLEPRHRAMMQARMRGETLLRIATRYQLTEGRMSQIESHILKRLQQAEQEAA